MYDDVARVYDMRVQVDVCMMNGVCCLHLDVRFVMSGKKVVRKVTMMIAVVVV